MSNIKEEILRYLAEYPPAYQVFEMLLQAGDVYVMGGLLREYCDNGRINDLRDADFCVDVKRPEIWTNLLETIPYTLNRFNGYKFVCSKFIIDVWNVKETWAFKEQKVLANEKNYFNKLPDTVFLNMDALVYDLKKDVWNDYIYKEAMKSRVLDIVLAENPFVELNIIRAMVLRKKYNMIYSKKLANIICEYGQMENFTDQAMAIQKKRYGYYVVDKKIIEEEIEVAKKQS